MGRSPGELLPDAEGRGQQFPKASAHTEVPQEAME